MEFTDLIGNLKTPCDGEEGKRRKAPQKKKTIDFKTTTISKDDEDDEQEDNEELSFLEECEVGILQEMVQK